MSILDSVAAAWPPRDWCDTTVVVAVSGGADSVALLRALHALKATVGGAGKLVGAHFNHRLRGAESDADQQFVRALCAELDIPCDTNREQVVPENPPAGIVPPDTLPADAGGGAGPTANRADEDSARVARYGFLARVVADRGARYLATAHTLNDQAETVLHRILRGTGLEGLAGIRRVREFAPGVALVRPLLSASREDVEDFLRRLGQPFREDSSNARDEYTRNRLRRDLLPRLQREFNPRVTESLSRLAELAREAQQIVLRRVEQVEDEVLLERDGDQVVLDRVKLQDVEPYVVRELLLRIWRRQGWPLRDMSFEKWTVLAGLVRQPNPAERKVTFPGHVLVEQSDSRLTLRREVAE